MSAARIGDPLDEATEVGPLAQHDLRNTAPATSHELTTRCKSAQHDQAATHPPWPVPGTGMAPQGRPSGPLQVQRNGRRVSDVRLIARLQLGHGLDHCVAGDINGLHDVVRPDK